MCRVVPQSLGLNGVVKIREQLDFILFFRFYGVFVVFFCHQSYGDCGKTPHGTLVLRCSQICHGIDT